MFFIAKRLVTHKIFKKDIEGVIFYREKETEILNVYPYDFVVRYILILTPYLMKMKQLKGGGKKENLHFLKSDFQDKKFDHYGYTLLIRALNTI